MTVLSLVETSEDLSNYGQLLSSPGLGYIRLLLVREKPVYLVRALFDHKRTKIKIIVTILTEQE